MSRLTFPRLTAAGLAACLVAGVAHSGYASLMSSTGHKGFEQRRVRCASGNIITYHLRRGRPGGPTLVCEAGLMSTSAAWLLVADNLDPALSILVYDRAGYRSSLRRCAEAYSLAESVNDLKEVITDGLGANSPYMLVGHSLGGYIIHRVAADAPGQLLGLVLIDPTHPRELMHSPKQREGSRGLNLTLTLGPWSAVFGSGLLIDKKQLFLSVEGSPHYRKLRVEGSAPSTWRATRREWDYSYAFMLDGGRPVDTLRVPVSVLAAESTLQQTPEQKELYEEYVASGSGGQLLTIPGSDHLTVTGGLECAPLTARALEEALAAAEDQHASEAEQEQGETA